MTIRNVIPRKAVSTRKFEGTTFYYVGRTIYSSKAYSVAEELKARGLGVAVTKRKDAGYLIWATERVWVDLSEPFYNPLEKFCCSICGACAPKAYLPHGQFEKRMSWLRRHYKAKHPRQFREFYQNPVLETIGASAIAGVGLGLGFRAVNWAADKLARSKGKNPAIYLSRSQAIRIIKDVGSYPEDYLVGRGEKGSWSDLKYIKKNYPELIPKYLDEDDFRVKQLFGLKNPKRRRGK